MNWKNSLADYGTVSITLHWSMALLVIGLFVLGLYMTGLDYYDPWYQLAPELHIGTGLLAGVLLVMRLLWRLTNPRPRLFGKPWEIRLAGIVHRAFYLLLFGLVISGYLISTADGQAISVFGWLRIPAAVTIAGTQIDRMGAVHEWLAYLTMGLAGLHSAAAIKHHFVDKDRTLTRILWPAGIRHEPPTQSQKEQDL